MDCGENAPKASLSVRRTFDSMVRFELKKLACGLGRPSGGPHSVTTTPLIDWEEVHYCRHGRQHWGKTGNGECSCKLTIMLGIITLSRYSRAVRSFPAL